MISVWFWNKYAVRPLHLPGGLAFISIFSGLIVSVVGIVFYIQHINLFKNILPVLSVFLFLSGVQLFVFGLMADMIARNYFGSTEDIPYKVKEVVQNKIYSIRDTKVMLDSDLVELYGVEVKRINL